MQPAGNSDAAQAGRKSGIARPLRGFQHGEPGISDLTGLAAYEYHILDVKLLARLSEPA